SIVGNAQLALGSFVLAQGGFAVTKTQLSGGPFTAANALLVSLTNLDVFAGVGAVYNANGSPTDYSDDTVNTVNAIGLSAHAAEITLALVTAPAGKYTGLQI